MPQVTVYIREHDLPKWKSIERKTQFISEALQKVGEPIAGIENKTAKNFEPRVVEIPGVVKGSEFVPKPPDPETGYPCCVKARPCKHWVFDDLESLWRNSLTGKTKES